MKALKFTEPLPKLILEGEKSTTWRINDDKNIIEGDELQLCHGNGKEFARAIAIYVRERRFKDLTEEDKEGHEKFLSENEMYKTYSEYYGFDVSPDTLLNVIKFRLKN